MVDLEDDELLETQHFLISRNIFYPLFFYQYKTT